MVLAGRPNVGKSTLVNRITGARRSIVAPLAGTTRDALAAPASWQNRGFTLVDTGGLFGATTDPLHVLVVEHGLRALHSADLVVFLVDGREGLVPGDEEIAHRLRALNKPIILVINKTDDKRSRPRINEFHALGFEPMFEIAAEHGDGVYELLDQIIALLGDRATKDTPKKDDQDNRHKRSDHDERSDGNERSAHDERSDEKERSDHDERSDENEAEADRETAVAIVGRPNVGKSSLVNRLVREERVMVSEMPGTTRDTVDVLLHWHKKSFRILDTAGMRRPGKVATAGAVESVSVVLSRRAMARADVAVVVIDATEGAGDREAAIAGEAADAGCGIVLAVNKWDLVRGQGQDWVEKFDDKLRFQLNFLGYAPIVHISALTGEHTGRLLEVIDRVATARRKRVSTAELNRFLEKATAEHPPVSPNRREVRILYGTQTKALPPSFMIFTNVASELHFSYERYLVNQLREAFGFEGTPIRLTIRRRAARPRKGRGRGREKEQS